MRILLTTLIAFISISFAFADNFWQDVSEQTVFLSEKSEVTDLPNDYRLVSLDLKNLKKHLQDAPMEGTAAAKSAPLMVTLPMPDGTMEVFEIVESPMMAPELCVKYPNIKTFLGRGTVNRTTRVRFDYGERGFNAVMHTLTQSLLITPYASHQETYYMVYDSKDLLLNTYGLPSIDPTYAKTLQDMRENLPAMDNSEKNGDNGLLDLRVYRFVLACTGEFANVHQATTTAQLLSIMNTATMTLNTLLENDLAIRLVLIGNVEDVLFIDPATDLYNNSNLGLGLLGQNQNVLDNVIGPQFYDVGHVFTGGCIDGVAGVVSGNICSGGKARGVTCHWNTNIVGNTMGTAAHEMAHQYTGGHTFSFCPGSEGQLNLGSAWEPGSGTTVLSYSGSCGAANNITTNQGYYYHGGNVGEMIFFTRMANGNSCANLNPTDNNEPEIDWPYEDGFYIPISTPFELDASATDADDDAITYCWEQLNLGTAPLGDPHLESPLFRSYPPITSSNRVIPRLPALVNNNTEITEYLADYSRNITFRMMVRDNNPGAGAQVWEDVSFEATESAGPFLVTHPNSFTSWQAGGLVEVTWDVANTTNTLVNCQTVNIRLSTNGGFAYPVTLLANTPNDGSEWVYVPEIQTNVARVRVEAAENIFFDISNQNFEITPADVPSYFVSPQIQSQTVCAPDFASVEILSQSILGFDDLVTLEIVEGLPANVGAEFSTTQITPGESSTLTLDFTDVSGDEVLELLIRATAPGADTTYANLFFDVIYSDFSQLELFGPVNGVSSVGLLPDFTWSELAHVDSYDFELATSPSFDPSTIVESATNLTEGIFTPSVGLLDNSLYFWRIRPKNICAEGEFATPFAFHTFTAACAPFTTSDFNVNIPSTGLPTIVSELIVVEPGDITDINVVQIKGNHDAVPDIQVRLQSPEGTEVILMDGECGNTSIFNVGFDDEAAFEIVCPPVSGIRYIPHEPLSAFVGESTLGTWLLEVEVINTIGSGGTLETWSLEFCASFEPNHPFLVNNDTLFVPPNEGRDILNTTLHSDDADNTPEELIYSIVTATEHGTVYLSGNALTVGDQFTQKDIDDGAMRYENENPDAITDNFTFVVQDGTGGWFGIPPYVIVIDPEAPNSTFDIDADNDIFVYPNPTSDLLNVMFKKAVEQDFIVNVSDVHGRLLNQIEMPEFQESFQINTSDFPNGIYFLTIQVENTVLAKKFSVQK